MHRVESFHVYRKSSTNFHCNPVNFWNAALVISAWYISGFVAHVGNFWWVKLMIRKSQRTQEYTITKLNYQHIMPISSTAKREPRAVVQLSNSRFPRHFRRLLVRKLAILSLLACFAILVTRLSLPSHSSLLSTTFQLSPIFSLPSSPPFLSNAISWAGSEQLRASVRMPEILSSTFEIIFFAVTQISGRQWHFRRGSKFHMGLHSRARNAGNSGAMERVDVGIKGGTNPLIVLKLDLSSICNGNFESQLTAKFPPSRRPLTRHGFVVPLFSWLRRSSGTL